MERALGKDPETSEADIQAAFGEATTRPVPGSEGRVVGREVQSAAAVHCGAGPARSPSGVREPMEKRVTEEQIDALAASDVATAALVSLLAGFLERKGVMQRSEFTAYLEEALAQWEREGANPAVLGMLRTRIALVSQPGDLPTLQ